MEVQRRVGDMVEAVGGRGQSRTGFYHQTCSTSDHFTTNHRVLERCAIHFESREKVLQLDPDPHTETFTEASTAEGMTRAQGLSPVLST